jgi:hypothetical protein
LTTLMRPSHPFRHFWLLRKSLFLLAFTFGAFGEAIGNTDAFNALSFAGASFLAE